MFSEIAGSLMVLVVVGGIALLIAWILLPFAMFGLKGRMSTLIAETQRTNALLEQLRDRTPNQ